MQSSHNAKSKNSSKKGSSSKKAGSAHSPKDTSKHSHNVSSSVVSEDKEKSLDFEVHLDMLAP